MVVTPPGVAASAVRDVVRRHRRWIETAFQRLAARQAELAASGKDASAPVTAPVRIELPALEENWSVRYDERPAPGRLVPVQTWAEPAAAGAERILHIRHGRGVETAQLVTALKGWLRDRAAATLPPELRRLAAACGLDVAGVRTGWQRSRWGSCTHAGVITLNAKLLFLPQELVRHVLLHELCHTRHLHHQDEFHDLLLRFDPQADACQRALRRAGRRVPDWAEDGRA